MSQYSRSQCSVPAVPQAWSARHAGGASRTRYLKEGGLPEGAVRSAILRSWQRCRSRGVDPRLNPSPPGLSPEQLDLQRLQQATLLRTAAPMLAVLHDGLSGQGAIIHLADKGGLILDARSDPVTFAQACEQGLVPGQDWSELAAGTNAIGTALAENRALQVLGGEHFCVGPQQWRCAAAPIHDPASGALLGVLNMSTAAQRDLDLVLPLVSAVACNLEQALQLEFQAARERLLSASLHRLSYRDGVVLFDRDGRLVEANRYAVQRLQDPRAVAAAALRGAASHVATPLADPLFRALDPAWLEPLWQRGELLGYLALIPRVDGAAGDATDPATDPATVLTPEAIRALEYLLEVPTIGRALRVLLQRWQPLWAATPPLPRSARLQQLLACSADLIHELDNLAREETPRFDSGALVRGTVARFQRDHGAAATCHIVWPPALALAGERRCFAQVLFNLLDNSHRHGFGSDRAGRIEIEGRVDDRRLILSYRDDGAGMDQATLLQMEDPGFSSAPIRQQGLGAFLNRLLIQHLFGGTLHATSQPGQGMQVRIAIPLDAPARSGPD